MLIMTIGLLPDASPTPAGREPDAMKPASTALERHWIRVSWRSNWLVHPDRGADGAGVS
jgi:hypothetical protein